MYKKRCVFFRHNQNYMAKLMKESIVKFVYTNVTMRSLRCDVDFKWDEELRSTGLNFGRIVTKSTLLVCSWVAQKRGIFPCERCKNFILILTTSKLNRYFQVKFIESDCHIIVYLHLTQLRIARSHCSTPILSD